jgi:hypothetical protein
MNFPPAIGSGFTMLLSTEAQDITVCLTKAIATVTSEAEKDDVSPGRTNPLDRAHEGERYAVREHSQGSLLLGWSRPHPDRR